MSPRSLDDIKTVVKLQPKEEMNEHNYGLIIEAPVIGEDYVLGGYGSLGGEILEADGQWTSWLPENEEQFNATLDTQACATFGTLSALEILARRVYGQHRNWSDRFLARVAETTPQGNSPHKVAETLRKKGVCNEVDWPFSKDITTWEEFYKDIPQAIFSLASSFIAEFDFKHEYVVPEPLYLKRALQYSPVAVSVYAWIKEGDLYVKPQGLQDNHWCVIVGYEEGKFWLIYDSYDPGNLKKYKWDNKFQVAKRYSLNRQVASESFWTKFLIWLGLAARNIEVPAAVTVDHTSPSPQPEPKYKWDTPADARHSVRLICDEEGLSLAHKNLICACIMQESQFVKDAVGVNRNSKGIIISKDWGLVQVNDTPGWHIGPGLEFPSVTYVLSNPEHCVRWMIRMMKAGKLHLWASYSSGAYKKYL